MPLSGQTKSHTQFSMIIFVLNGSTTGRYGFYQSPSEELLINHFHEQEKKCRDVPGTRDIASSERNKSASVRASSKVSESAGRKTTLD